MGVDILNWGEQCDNAGRIAHNSIFGQRIIAHEISEFNAMFAYPLDTRKAKATVANGGAVTTENFMLKVSTGTAVNGSAYVSSRRSLRYVPGQEGYTKFTAIFTTGKTQQKHYIGLIDDLNGWAVGMNGTKFCIFSRRNGVTSIVEQKDFNVDKLDGTGDSKFNIDPSKGNIFRISFGFLGFAPITFEILGTDDKWTVFHKLRYHNTATETHVSIPYIKVGAYCINEGNNTDIILRSGSLEVGRVNGGNLPVSSRDFSYARNDFTLTAGTDQRIVVFHNKATYGSVENRIEALLAMITANIEANKPVAFALYKIVAPTGGTWTDVSTNSAMEYSIDTTISMTGAELLLPFNLAKVDSLQPYDVTSLNLRLLPDEYALFAYTVATVTGTASLGIRWQELF